MLSLAGHNSDTYSIEVGQVHLHTVLNNVKQRMSSFFRRFGSHQQDYSELPQFANYAVDEGLLLDLKEEGDTVELTVEAPNTFAHPKAGWSKIVVKFPNAKSVRWIEKKMQLLTDVDGTHYGDIDNFVIERHKSHLSGDWGEVEIVSDPVEVTEVDSWSFTI